jgi:hypothetical protein
LLSILGLFNSTFDSSDYLAPNDSTMVNHKFGRIWKGAIVAKLQVLPRKLPGDTDKSTENFS